ncbi:transcriptional regulator MntR [Listeria seeligeri]|uniref:transcriptional regulator MntR n=1 Tax=Listeria seeligeri TaxID=1640 RepID=UPI001623D980|nr:transcriptional regulator MntR [Listeria seeligeri]MBC2017494.1 transcriptional regulator MntR [Listeria seeligeri]
MPTPSMEDYIEKIYSLIETKGYARVSDIADELFVHPSSVTKMVQKLDKDEYLIYEKYRGLILTTKGTQMGKRLLERHALLESFLSIIGVEESHIYHDVEGIEHHLSWNSIDRIGDVVKFFEEHPDALKALKAMEVDKPETKE